MEESYRLERRFLTEDDSVWLGLFSAGVEYWGQDVSEFLRVDAIPQWRSGYSTTSIYSMPGHPGVVGFISASVGHWSASKIQKSFPEWTGPMVDLPDKIPVMLLPNLAVAMQMHGNG